MKFYETYDCKTNRKYWWTQRDANGRYAEIRRNDGDRFDLFVCEVYNSTHNTLQDAMNEAEKFVGGHIVNG